MIESLVFMGIIAAGVAWFVREVYVARRRVAQLEDRVSRLRAEHKRYIDWVQLQAKQQVQLNFASGNQIVELKRKLSRQEQLIRIIGSTWNGSAAVEPTGNAQQALARIRSDLLAQIELLRTSTGHCPRQLQVIEHQWNEYAKTNADLGVHCASVGDIEGATRAALYRDAAIATILGAKVVRASMLMVAIEEATDGRTLQAETGGAA